MALITSSIVRDKFLQADFSNGPTSDPGDGNVWFNHGFACVGNASIAGALGYTPANDANVIHTTGNETKTGNFTLAGTLNVSADNVIAFDYASSGVQNFAQITQRGNFIVGGNISATVVRPVLGFGVDQNPYGRIDVTTGGAFRLYSSYAGTTLTSLTASKVIFDSTYEAETSSLKGDNAHTGLVYRGVVKAGLFVSSANGFGADQVALGTISGTSITPQAYILPNTDGVKVTQGNRTTLGAVYANSIQLDYDSSSVTNFSQITHRGNFIVGGNVSSTAVRPVLSFYQGGATYGRIDVTSAGAFRFYTGSGGTTDAPISAGAATFSGTLTHSGYYSTFANGSLAITGNGQVVGYSDTLYGWSNGSYVLNGTASTLAISRQDVNTVEINNGTRVASGGTYKDLKAGAATFSGNMTFSGSTPRINFTASGLDTFIQHTAANTLQLGVNNAGRLQIGTAGVRLLDTGGDFGWSDFGLVRTGTGAGSIRSYYSGGAAWQTNVRGGASASGATLGFFSTTPAIQVTGGAATAGATYTSAEQTMLQTLWDMARTYGLLS